MTSERFHFQKAGLPSAPRESQLRIIIIIIMRRPGDNLARWARTSWGSKDEYQVGGGWNAVGEDQDLGTVAEMDNNACEG